MIQTTTPTSVPLTRSSNNEAPGVRQSSPTARRIQGNQLNDEPLSKALKRRRYKERRKARSLGEASMDIDSTQPATSTTAPHDASPSNGPPLHHGTTIATLTETLSNRMRLHSPEADYANDADEELDILTPEERLRIEQRNAARRERIERRDRVKARQAEGMQPHPPLFLFPQQR